MGSVKWLEDDGSVNEEKAANELRDEIEIHGPDGENGTVLIPYSTTGLPEGLVEGIRVHVELSA